MSPQQLEKLEALFQEACQLPADQRRRFVERSCGEDSTLRAQLDALLHADGKQHSPLDAPLLSPQAIEAALDGSAPTPTRIGSYRVLRLIGAGGMGIVYEAEQENPRRRVAIKLLRPGAASGQAIRRFELEAQLLARLQHPGIARIYEAGSIEELHWGVPLRRPYLVMEYIDGEPLQSFAEQARLSLSARLALMIQVCDAVQHAHQRGVIHRDLKPGNILVSDEANDARDAAAHGADSIAESSSFRRKVRAATAQVKVLDFGVARVSDLGEPRTTQTLTGQIIGTVPYMSPEQLSGDTGDIDVRSDVYSLGVLLFELLCGRLPHSGSTPLELARRICEDPPPRLSSISRTLRGDLETIVLKALEKDRARRYQSAAELRKDLALYLNSEPIEARRASGLYVLRMTIARHRFAAGALLGFLVLTSVATVALGLLYRRAETARAAADLRAEALRRSNYLSTIAVAQIALRDGNTRQADQLLSSCPTDLRAWEWFYLVSQCDTSRQTIRAHDATAAVAFSPHTGELVSFGYDRVVRIWDLERETARLTLATGSMAHTVAFSPRDSRIAVATRFPFIQVWDLAAPGEPLRLPAHRGNAWATLVAWSPTGETIASTTNEPIVQVYDVADPGEPVQRIRTDGGASALAFLDGTRLAVGNDRGDVEVWDARTARRVAVWPGHTDRVEAMTLAPDGTRLISRSIDASIRIWDTECGACTHRVDCPPSRPGHVAVAPNGRRFVCGVALDLREWDLVTGVERGTRLGHRAQIIGVAFSADGATLASSDVDGVVKLWDAEPREEPRTLAAGRGGVSRVALSADGERIAAAGRNGEVRVWSARHGELLLLFQAHPEHATVVEFAASDRALVTGGYDGAVHLWEVHTGAPLRTFSADGARVRGLAVSPDGTRVAISRETGDVEIYDAVTGRLRRSFVAHEETTYDIVFAPDLSWFATCSATGAISIWDARTGREVRTLRGHEGRVFTLDLSRDGRRLASGGLDRTVRIWDLSRDDPPRVLLGHHGSVLDVAFLPQGNRLVSVGAGDVVYLWDVESGRQAIALSGHTRSVDAVAVTHDGERIVTGSVDDTVKVWDAGPQRSSRYAHE
ncbi:MAG: protein kinase [Phycisphaerae bacterium]